MPGIEDRVTKLEKEMALLKALIHKVLDLNQISGNSIEAIAIKQTLGEWAAQ